MEKISYAGKKVSVGIDVHAESYQVTCVVEGKVVAREKMRAEPGALIKYLKRRFRESVVSTAYEAGFSGFELHRELALSGISNIVVNAASIEVAARDRVKTDKRDSEKLATQLEAGRLRSIRIPSREEEASRVLHRTREQLVQDRTALMVQVRMRFYQFGYKITVRKERLSLKLVARALKSELPTEVRQGIESMVEIWKALNAQIRRIEKLQAEQAAKDPKEKTFRSIPGVGFQTARILSTELGDMSQFPNERKLFSFSGLTPSERSSGTKERKGSISRQGSGRIRRVLVEAAWMALRRDRELKRNFEALASRIGKRKAIVAIARKLLGRARALFRTGEMYCSQPMLKCAA